MTKVVGFYTCWNFEETRLEEKVLKGLEAQCLIARSEVEFKTLFGKIDALVIANEADITAEVAAALAPRCKIIVRQGIGVDNIELTACKNMGIAVANVPDYCLEEVSDHALALALTLARNIPFYDAMIRGGAWNVRALPAGSNYQGLTLAICGFGRIPQSLARKAGCVFGRLVTYDPYINREGASKLGVEVVDTFEALVREADILSLHIPATAENHHIINAQSLSWFKPTASLVNTARGALIDEVALYQALKNQTLASAALDVLEIEPPDFNNPLITLPNVVITPHSAWYSYQAFDQMRLKAAEEIARGLCEEPLKNQVNR